MLKLVLLILAFAIFTYSQYTKEPTSLPSMELDLFHNLHQEIRSTERLGGPCEKENCLAIYLAPWCGYCRQMHPTIIEMKRKLSKDGINVDVILGMDTPENLIAYAKTFPFSVTLDPDRQFIEAVDGRGVPLFVVSDTKGIIIKKKSGGSNNFDTMKKALNL